VPRERFDSVARRELADALEGGLARYEPHVAVLDSARALATPGAALVIAGQQPGFLGGPLMHAYKALHAIRLARALREAWNTPVVPAFWNHADDHDVAEVHHLWIQNQNLDLRKVGLAGVSSGRMPLSLLVFDEERNQLAALRALLRQNLASGAPDELQLERFLPRAGESFAAAFTRVLLDLFGHHGLVVIEPDWLRPGLSRALAALVAEDLRGLLGAGVQGMARSGIAPAIDPGEAALLFRLDHGRRRALRFAPDGYRYDGEPGSRTGTELAAEIVQALEEWSPGALLRPVAQDLVLPTAAYVGGYGELHYHAQLGELRDAVGAPRVPFVPRLSATVVDPDTRLALERLDLSVADVLGGVGAEPAPGGPEEQQGAPPIVERLRALAGESSERLLELRAELAELDPGLAVQLKRAAGGVRDSIEGLAEKAERVHQNRTGKGERHRRRVRNALLPRDEPQERVRGLLELAVRFGTGWLDDLLAECEPLPTEHLVIHLEEEASQKGPR
jgi:bacillithiol biosynthesis cysteine-adding enzyme BshC